MRRRKPAAAPASASKVTKLGVQLMKQTSAARDPHDQRRVTLNLATKGRALGVCSVRAADEIIAGVAHTVRGNKR
jgi:hypothetical protein